MIHRSVAGRLTLAAMLWALLIGVYGWSTGCAASRTTSPITSRPVEPKRSEARQPKMGPKLVAVSSEPAIRVRIERSAAQVVMNGPGPLTVSAGDPSVPATPRAFDGPITLRWVDGAFVLTDGQHRTVRWALPSLRVELPSGAVAINNHTYPGALVVQPDAAGRLDVINHLPLESYLPGVLERELYGSWDIEAFRAQAIAARSYALWEMQLRPDRTYDLESTVASQAYSGAASNPKAIDAVQNTRGQVLSYNGKVVPAFFSSCSGGAGQDAAVAFPGRVDDIPPLRGRDHGGWGSGSSKFRWGPITRGVSSLSQRIAAWGRAEKHAVAALGTLQAITITQRSSTGRPAVFTLTDAAGRRFVLPAESFRFACNYEGPGAPTLPADRKLYSSHVTPTVTGSTVTFSDGRGHGHGVGMDQWGAQGMAKAGYNYLSILSFYYPQSVITRVYR